jgi:predicted aminopeptidase
MENSIRIPISLLALFLLTGCETLDFYAQAVGGQLAILRSAQPMADLLADPATPKELRERLELARSIREFASTELKLPDNGSYRSYADIGRPYVVWNVVAAGEFSLDPVESCFVVAGCVPYRGFFAREEAEHHAEHLRKAGNDVNLRGVAAYSTLGRFDDPLLSTFIRNPDADLARLIFHELAHQLLYVKGDSTFNESFAVAVEHAGVRRWLAATGRSGEMARLTESQERGRNFVATLERTRMRLKALYATRLPPAVKREQKRLEFAELKKALASNPRFKDVQANNALLASFATYTQLVPAFESILAEEGGDLERFYSRVRALAASGPSSRGPLSALSR